MYSLRILSKGKVTDLSNGFALGGVPFTVFVRPKEVTMETSTLLKCKLICDKEFGMFPVPIGDWTPGAITVISPNGIDLSVYDVYWGAGKSGTQCSHSHSRNDYSHSDNRNPHSHHYSH